MKLSDITGKLWEGASWVSHTLTLTDIVKAFTGKGSENIDPTSIPGWQGVFGLGDERQFSLLLTQLEEDERESIINFMEYAFKVSKNPTPEERFVVWYYLNRFRTFVCQMGTSGGKELSSTTITTKYKDEKGRDATEVKTFKDLSDSTNNALTYLQHMAAVIKKAAGKTPLKGNKALIREFRQTGAPFIPDNAVSFTEEAERIIGKHLGVTRQWLENATTVAQARQARRRPKGFFRRQISLFE